MRLFKGLFLFLAVGAICALIFAVRAQPRPLTAIDRIQPAMNYAYVRVAGVVVGYPTLADDFLSFTVADDDGRIRVMAYRRAVRELQRNDRIPAPGDRVALEGTLRIREEDASLVLGAADALQIERPEPLAIELAGLDALRDGERAVTIGQIRRVRRVADRLVIVTLRHGSATADVPLPRTVLPDPAALRPGKWLRVTGGAGEYRDTRQILPSEAADLAPADPLPFELRPISALDANLLGAWVTVRGAVTDFRPFTGGMRLELRDKAGKTVDAVVFDSAWQAVPFSETLRLGDDVQVSGLLSEFRGRFELMPELTVDIEAEEGSESE
ncbi:MAG: OB-fold nucleic acid binding domain-containing protein [Chloroflexi bacterium]|nr:OB-fold nucleic acid binding domain-containing protein [Chloroflexota bacterium]